MYLQRTVVSVDSMVLYLQLVADSKMNENENTIGGSHLTAAAACCVISRNLASTPCHCIVLALCLLIFIYTVYTVYTVLYCIYCIYSIYCIYCTVLYCTAVL
jgi:hypothetical protein